MTEQEWWQNTRMADYSCSLNSSIDNNGAPSLSPDRVFGDQGYLRSCRWSAMEFLFPQTYCPPSAYFYNRLRPREFGTHYIALARVTNPLSHNGLVL
jgi:hypothetical protein